MRKDDELFKLELEREERVAWLLGSASFGDELTWTNQSSFHPLFSSDPTCAPRELSSVPGPGPRRPPWSAGRWAGRAPRPLAPHDIADLVFPWDTFLIRKVNLLSFRFSFLKINKNQLINCSIFISWRLKITKGGGADLKVHKYCHFTSNGAPFSEELGISSGSKNSSSSLSSFTCCLLHAWECDPVSPAHFIANPAQWVGPTEAKGPDSGGHDYTTSPMIAANLPLLLDMPFLNRMFLLWVIPSECSRIQVKDGVSQEQSLWQNTYTILGTVRPRHEGRAEGSEGPWQE